MVAGDRHRGHAHVARTHEPRARHRRVRAARDGAGWGQAARAVPRAGAARPRARESRLDRRADDHQRGRDRDPRHRPQLPVPGVAGRAVRARRRHRRTPQLRARRAGLLRRAHRPGLPRRGPRARRRRRAGVPAPRRDRNGAARRGDRRRRGGGASPRPLQAVVARRHGPRHRVRERPHRRTARRTRGGAVVARRRALGRRLPRARRDRQAAPPRADPADQSPAQRPVRPAVRAHVHEPRGVPHAVATGTSRVGVGVRRGQRTALLGAYRDLLANSGHTFNFIQEIRFSRADEFWLSPAYRRDSVWLSLYNIDSDGRWRNQLAMFEAFARSHGGRPHWGKEAAFDAPYSPDSTSSCRRSARSRASTTPSASSSTTGSPSVSGCSRVTSSRRGRAPRPATLHHRGSRRALARRAPRPAATYRGERARGPRPPRPARPCRR